MLRGAQYFAWITSFRCFDRWITSDILGLFSFIEGQLAVRYRENIVWIGPFDGGFVSQRDNKQCDKRTFCTDDKIVSCFRFGRGDGVVLCWKHSLVKVKIYHSFTFFIVVVTIALQSDTLTRNYDFVMASSMLLFVLFSAAQPGEFDCFSKNDSVSTRLFFEFLSKFFPALRFLTL